MRLNPIFYFTADDDGAGGSGNGGGADAATAQGQEQGQGGSGESNVPDKIDLSMEELKSFGFDSKEKMIEFLTKKKEADIPEEAKQKELELENAKFRTFAIAEGHMTEADFKSHERLLATADKDLVFSSYVEDFKAENPDIPENEVAEAAKIAFDAEYKTASEKRIKKEAQSIRSEVVSKFNTAREDFDFAKKWDGNKTAWAQFVSKTLTEALPKEMTLFEGKDGDDEIKITVELTDEEKLAIHNAVVTQKRYAQFLKGDTEELAKLIREKAIGVAERKYLKQAIEKGVKQGIDIGKKRGSYVGATNPFPLVNSTGGSQKAAAPGAEADVKNSHAQAANLYPVSR